MEWIRDYWYVIIAGIIAAMFFFGHRTKHNMESNETIRAVKQKVCDITQAGKEVHRAVFIKNCNRS